MKEMIAIIEKNNIHIGYKGNKKGLMIDNGISENDFEYVKKHKEEIREYLEEKEREEEKQREERFFKEYLEKYHKKELEEAKRTGAWVVYSKEMEPCNDPNEECNWDYITRSLKVTENGIEVKTTRQHTW